MSEYCDHHYGDDYDDDDFDDDDIGNTSYSPNNNNGKECSNE